VPEQDIPAEGTRLLEAAASRGVPLRLIGGVAVRLRAGDRYPAGLDREYADVDFVTAAGAGRDVEALMTEEGYEPYHEFNVINGSRRLLFFDHSHDRQADVFVGSFVMCHEIPVSRRLEVDEVSIPLAELLLTKLQIVELNEKDIRDALALIASHGLAEADGDTVNAGQVAELCASDWGLWRTITKNLDALRAHVGNYELDADERARIEERIAALLERIEQEPKSMSWRIRARVGERVRWYDLPEEVAGNV
jgi:hypothetical protein